MRTRPAPPSWGCLPALPRIIVNGGAKGARHEKLIFTVAIAALLAGRAAPPLLARGGQRHHGIWSGHSYHAGHYFRHRPYYGYRHRHHRHGGHSSIRGGGAVVLGILAGAVILGSLLSRPAPARAPVLRSPTGAPLGGCIATTGTGTWYGHPARFSGTMCYDPAGRAYALREKLVKIGAKVVRHGRYVTFQLAEVAVPRELFRKILSLIDDLRRRPTPA